MVFSILGNVAPFVFEMAGQDWRVLDFSLRERISTPFGLELTLASEDEIDFQDVLLKEGLFAVLGKDANRYVHGVVNRFFQAGTIEAAGRTRFFLYYATVVPSLSLLALEQDCRIFQTQSVPEIVRTVLLEGGVSPDRISFRLKGNYEPKEYCVQYRETDLDFISRLLEAEGIFYFFEHGKDGHTMVFGDSVVNYAPIPGNPGLMFNPADGLAVNEEFVSRFALSRRVNTGIATLRDFNFQRPSLYLTCDSQAQCEWKPEAYDYPGIYEDVERGKSLAKVRLQEATMFRDTATGKSSCPRLTPGFWFSLEEHDLEGFNRDYLVVGSFQFGAQPQVIEERFSGTSGLEYDNQFFCIPAEVDFRPERTTPRPVVEGVQTAIVVGPPGEEIYTDKHGRIKVQFHWDREGKKDEKSSCWIRVGQIWAGAGWGAVYIPRVGHEVIVDFLEGDPDRPIVTGSVYNGANPSPYSLPDKKTKSVLKSDSTVGGGGSNELTFDDAKGNEEVYVHAQKDWTIAVENDKTQAVGRNEQLRVTSNRNKTVGVAQSETVGGRKSITVAGRHNETIVKNARITFSGGSFFQDVQTSFTDCHVKGAVKEKYDATQKTLAGSDIDIQSEKGSIFLKATTDIVLATGSAKLTLKTDGTIKIEGASNVIGLSEKGMASTLKIGAETMESMAIEHRVDAGVIASKADGDQYISGAEVRIVSEIGDLVQKLVELLSYGFFDWKVTGKEEVEILALLESAPDLSRVVEELERLGKLEALFERVDGDKNRRDLLRMLGGGLDENAGRLVAPHVRELGVAAEIQYNLASLGVDLTPANFDPSPYSDLISDDPSAPFTGVGATGENPTRLDVPLGDAIRLGLHEYKWVPFPETYAEYYNPIGDLKAYLRGLSAQDRKRQVELLTRQPVSVPDNNLYAGEPPSRRQIIEAAAEKHNLEPELLTAFLLAELRDQSKLEDAKDYEAAVSIIHYDSSIGLGQVKVSTARNSDLFSDLLSSETRKDLEHGEIAELLASDEANIFAAAKYIRLTADQGASVDIATLPNTQGWYPGIDMDAYSKHSQDWPGDNIEALASEYTSTAWDDGVAANWGRFVYEGYKDAVDSEEFK